MGLCSVFEGLSKIKIIVFVSAFISVIFTGCKETASEDGKGTLQDFTTFDTTYFDDMDAAAYAQYLQETFCSLLPLCEREAAMGTETMSYYFGCLGEVEYDTVITYGGGIYWKNCGKLPVFYGLLKETEQYLSDKGQLHTEGDTILIYAEEVEQMTNLLLHGEIPLLHQSVAGAEYDEEAKAYRYRALEDPFQSYYDKGWQLLIPGSKGESAKTSQNGTAAEELYWYADDGGLYDIYGELLAQKCDLELLEGNLWLNHLYDLGVRQVGDNHVDICSVIYVLEEPEEDEEPPVFGDDTPIQIRVGSTFSRLPEKPASVEALTAP